MDVSQVCGFYEKELRDFVFETLEMIATDNGELFDEIDVKFRVGKSFFHGIRAFFALQSDVFRAMLFGGMQESEKDAIISLDDFTPKTMEFIQVFSFFSCTF